MVLMTRYPEQTASTFANIYTKFIILQGSMPLELPFRCSNVHSNRLIWPYFAVLRVFFRDKIPDLPTSTKIRQKSTKASIPPQTSVTTM
jgi:hypothetical protein